MACLAGETKSAEHGYTSLPVEPFEIAEKAGIYVQAKSDIASGVSGMLLKSGNNFGILYATHIKSEGFQRFSVGHELGHYFLSGHPEAVLKNGVHESRAGFLSQDAYELEADRFSVGLLMPQKLFVPAMNKAGEGVAAIESLSAMCKTSLTATAIRFVQCTREPAALIVSTNGYVDYCFMSNSLKEYEGIDWLRKRAALAREVPTFQFNQDSKNVEQSAKLQATSDLQDWFGGTRSIEVSEDVIGLGDYGKTLTLLYNIDLPDEDDLDDEDAEASWATRFHR